MFLVGGQSNAKPDWASGVERALRDSGRYENMLVVHAYHPGCGLYQWWEKDDPAHLYLEDFFNEDNTGLLETKLTGIEAAGDTWSFQGFFWLQGEGDTVPNATAWYGHRFTTMLGQLQDDLAMDEPFPFVIGVIDANQSPEYDDDLAAMGKTREDIEAVRQVQFALAQAAPHGVALDTRGYRRGDVWHVSRDYRVPLEERVIYQLGYDFGEAYLNAVPEPSTLMTFSVGVLWLVRRRRKG